MPPSTVPKPRRLLRGADVGYALTFRSWKTSEKSRWKTPQNARVRSQAVSGLPGILEGSGMFSGSAVHALISPPRESSLQR
jgi:hypothetical protein